MRLALCAGDMNETMSGPTDRLIGPTGQTHGSNAYGCIHHMALSDGWSDLYRDLHPAEEVQGDDGPALGHTFYGNHTQGSSRISYAMLYPRPEMDTLLTATCLPDNQVNHSSGLGGGYGHRPLLFSIPCEDILMTRAPSAARSGWSQPSVSVSNLSRDKAASLSERIESALARDADRWCQAMDSISAHDPQAETVFGDVSSQFVESLFGTASKGARSSPGGPP